MKGFIILGWIFIILLAIAVYIVFNYEKIYRARQRHLLKFLNTCIKLYILPHAFIFVI